MSIVGEAQLDARTGSIRWCSSCRAVYRSDFARCPVDGEKLAVGDTDPLIGSTLGAHYVIDSFIGEGAMARVYRAHHAILTSKQFAVKVMLGDLAATLEMRLRFAAEADSASQLAHPHVVSVVDFGRSESGLMYLVMELVPGKSLLDVITAEGGLAPRRALALARQICLGLAHAHERGLVHRDLKPENIIIAGKPEQARIVDFGLAVAMDDERSTRLTAVGLAMGTPIYAAPEQTHNEPVDHRADLFAFGVTLFEMLAGKPPFEGGIIEIIRQNASDLTPPLVGRNGKPVARPIEAVVRKLMRRDPKDRYQDASEVLAALEAAQLAPSKIVALPGAHLDAAATIPLATGSVPGATVSASPPTVQPFDPVAMSSGSTVSLEPRRPVLRALVGLALAAGIAFGTHYALDARDATSTASGANVIDTSAVVAAPGPAAELVATPTGPGEPIAAASGAHVAPAAASSEANAATDGAASDAAPPVGAASVAAPSVGAPSVAASAAPLGKRVVGPAQSDDAKPVARVIPRSQRPVTTIAAANAIAHKPAAPVADAAFTGGPTSLSHIPEPTAEQKAAVAATLPSTMPQAPSSSRTPPPPTNGQPQKVDAPSAETPAADAKAVEAPTAPKTDEPATR
ncbi:MAG TPA: protein kinase [Kofleriaceae bacterium]